ncbi:MAG: portal protein [Desulfovibrionaceae bacterium]
MRTFPNDSKDIARELERRLGVLQAKRRPWNPIYEEVADYIGPAYRGFLSKPTTPQERRDNDLDSTARRASLIWAAGLRNGMSNPADRWFNLGLDDDDMAKWPPAARWLQGSEDRYYARFGRSNFYQALVVNYQQLGLFGVNSLYIDEDAQDGMRFMAMPMHQANISFDSKERLTVFYRVMGMSPTDLVHEYGEKALHETVRKAYDKGGDEGEVQVLHAVFPRENGNRGPFANNLPYASFIMDLDNSHLMAEGGYEHMPFSVSRWFVLPGMAYSYSPGTEALADNRMLNEIKAHILEAGQMAVRPAYMVPDDGFIGKFSMEPGALNYYRKDETTSASDFQPLSVGGDPRFGVDLLNEAKREIDEAFMVDLFLSLRQRINSGSTPTAQEVYQLNNERMFLLGPMLDNYQREFNTIFDRIFSLMWRRREIPPPPRELAGHTLRVKFVSPLMLAQAANKTKAIMQGYAYAQQIAAVAGPQVLDNFKHDENVRAIAEQSGFPADGLQDPKAVAAIRQQRAQQEQAAKMNQELAGVAAMAPNLSKAPEEGSPGKMVMDALGGAA